MNICTGIKAERPLVIIAGPTAIGKSEISIMLAKRIGGEIVSADSVQVYRNMNIGSAKITEDQKQGIRHYLIDVLDPDEEFSAALFKDMAAESVNKIYSDSHIPIIAGGTGFYIQGLLYDIDFSGSSIDEKYRKALRDFASENGNEALWEKLRIVDPESAEKIHPNNVKRVMRALEYNKDTGKKISAHNNEQHRKKSPYDFFYFVLTDDRETIYQRIDERVDKMMADGLEDEVKRLLDIGCTRDMVSMQALGYRQISSYLAGEETIDEAVDDIKKETRHFAKRQLTWFAREKDVIWIDKRDFGRDNEKIAEMIENKIMKYKRRTK